MKVKSDFIGSTEIVTRYAESQTRNVNNQMPVSDLDVSLGQEVFVELYIVTNAESESIAEYDTSVYSSGPRITLPRDVVKENNLRPGMKLRVMLWDFENKKSTTSNNREGEQDKIRLDTDTVGSDESNEDGLSSRLRSEAVCSYLDKDIKKPLIYKNLSNGQQEEETVTQNKTRESFTFASHVRESLQVSEGDEIELLKPTNHDEQTELVKSEDTDEKVAEIHEMVSELYEAYKND